MTKQKHVRSTEEVLKLALEALEGLEALLLSMGLTYLTVYGDAEKAVTALQEALAEQPAQQEPVRHWSDCATNNRGCPELLGTCDCGGIPSKPELVAWLLEFVDEDGLPRRDVFYEQQHLQRHVKHNTDLRGLTCKVTPLYASPPAQQEPVATVTSESGDTNVSMSWWHEPALPVGTKLYTSPPTLSLAHRKPLTDDEIWREYRFLWPFHPAEERMLASDILMFARAIEAAHGIKENT